MAVSTATKAATSPVISWEKGQAQLKTKKNNPLLIVAMVAIALLALAGFWRIMHRPAPVKFIQVMAARRDIPAGSRLSMSCIKFLDVPKQYAKRDMITSLNDVSGRVIRTYLPAGEPIRAFMLFSGEEGLSGNLETHERAITLQLDDDALVDHSILPDDRVDLLAVSSKEGKKYTKTICQNVRVLMSASKEQAFARGSNGSVNKITLAVTPDVAEAITEAVEAGKIRLILRSRLNITEQHLAGASPDDLLPANANTDSLTPIAPPALLPAPPPPAVSSPEETSAESGPLQWMVEVISGNHKETYAVPAK